MMVISPWKKDKKKTRWVLLDIHSARSLPYNQDPTKKRRRSECPRDTLCTSSHTLRIFSRTTSIPHADSFPVELFLVGRRNRCATWLDYRFWVIPESKLTVTWINTNTFPSPSEIPNSRLVELLPLTGRSGGLGSSTIFKKFNEPYAPS